MAKSQTLQTNKKVAKFTLQLRKQFLIGRRTRFRVIKETHQLNSKFFIRFFFQFVKMLIIILKGPIIHSNLEHQTLKSTLIRYITKMKKSTFDGIKSERETRTCARSLKQSLRL